MIYIYIYISIYTKYICETIIVWFGSYGIFNLWIIQGKLHTVADLTQLGLNTLKYLDVSLFSNWVALSSSVIL